MKTLLTAAVLALALSACAGTSGGTQAYGEIKGGVETSHIRSGR